MSLTNFISKNICDDYIKGMRIKDIIKKYNVTRPQVGYVLEKRNIARHFGKPLDDLTGQKFGLLEVLRMAITPKSKGGRWRAICKCHGCGKDYYDANPQSIKRGWTTSCGCRRDQYKKITGKNNKMFVGYEEIRGGLWKNIVRSAKKRGHEFNITIEHGWETYIKQKKRCALTNIPIVFGRSAFRKETTASLDRIDSTKGYISGNVQWVHKDVNIIKDFFSEKYFVNICRRIANNISYDKIPLVSNDEELLSIKDRIFGDWQNYKSSLRQKGGQSKKER